MDPDPLSFFIAGSADDTIALSAIVSYKTQNLFGFVFGGPLGGPGNTEI